MREDRTIFEFMTDWFSIRRGARLVVDGLIALAVSGIVYALWYAWIYLRPVDPAEVHSQQSLVNLGFQSVIAITWYLGVTLIAVGCSRIIADGVRARDSNSSAERREEGGHDARS